MWKGKHKALTFSFDDGVTQDVNLIKILDDYGLKATFNLNSQLLGSKRQIPYGDKFVDHNKVFPSQVAQIYAKHEVAVHTLTHVRLPEQSDEEVVRQVRDDQMALQQLVGYDICGMAYPCGGVNNDDRVAGLIAQNTNIKYARTISSTHNFELQTNLLRFNPSVYYIHKDKLFELAHQFLTLDSQSDKLFYVWGHSYEMDSSYISWQEFEKFCKLISNRDDIFYGTNAQVLLDK